MATMPAIRTPWHLGMPHTTCRRLSEVALLIWIADVQWKEMARLTGCPASRQRDAEGREVYASVYYVELADFPPAGLATFGPDDHLEVVTTLGRYGKTMLDAEHRLYAAGALGATLPDPLPPAPRIRLSNVLVGMAAGAADARQITTPANARVDAIPPLPAEPDSYRLIKLAQAQGEFFPPPDGSRRLWDGEFHRTAAIDPDRDLNGVGLLYFANYVAFMDAAERAALAAAGVVTAAIDGRVTVRRRTGYYGNARPDDRLHVAVEGFRIGPDRLLLQHRVRRESDERLIAVSSVEKRCPIG